MKARIFVMAVCLLALESFSFGQSQTQANSSAPQSRQRFLVSTVQVQLAAQAAWEDLIRKEYVPALRKAGVTQFIVLKADTLGRSGEYILSRPFTDVADLDNNSQPIIKSLGNEGAKALIARLDRITESLRTFAVTMRPELSISPAPGHASKHVHIITESVAPGRTAEYEDASKERLAIARKANAKGILVGRVGSGGNPNEYRNMFYHDSYAEAAKWAEANSRMTAEAKIAPIPVGVIVHQERANYLYLPELSILPDALQPAK
jgi:hypothetical protein